MKRSVRADGAATKERLLDAAVELVASGGLPALTQRAVASEACVPPASIVYHLQSTVELRRATLEHAGAQIGTALAARLREAEADPRRIPAICADYAVELVRERRSETVCAFELLTAASFDVELRPMVKLFNDRLATLLVPIAGSQRAAYGLGAAMQGCVLIALATDAQEDLWRTVFTLVATPTVADSVEHCSGQTSSNLNLEQSVNEQGIR
ncbi:MAG: TetR/AcrR family transcriptional regulator [Ancrocorticia sp.]|uniref:TetR/AcrR family transcriptional regulator n=1 Tax=Ancrocorticia sp. TaxID=2593684 RepID=UPI003F92F670